MSRTTVVKEPPKKPSKRDLLLQSACIGLFRHFGRSYEGLVLLAYRRPKNKRKGVVVSTFVRGDRFSKKDQAFLRKNIVELPEEIGL